MNAVVKPMLVPTAVEVPVSVIDLTLYDTSRHYIAKQFFPKGRGEWSWNIDELELDDVYDMPMSELYRMYMKKFRVVNANVIEHMERNHLVPDDWIGIEVIILGTTYMIDHPSLEYKHRFRISAYDPMQSKWVSRFTTCLGDYADRRRQKVLMFK
jgi:hypothetical protein